MAFVKTTFSLIYLANKREEIQDFEIKNNDFTDDADLLYHDYVQVMYLSKCILSETGLEHKKKLFADLKPFVEKTNYAKIYDILEDLDLEYPKYCA